MTLVERVKKFAGKNQLFVNIDRLLARFKLSQGFNLDTHQYQLLHNVFNYNLSILDCGPGTGACAAIGLVGRLFQKVYAISPSIICAAGLSASDNPSEVFNERIPEDARLLIVTDFHLISHNNAVELFNTIPLGCKVLLVGDSFQVPINPQITINHLKTAGVPVAEFPYIDRNLSSPLIINTHRIKHGHDITCGHNFDMIEAEDDLLSQTISAVKETLSLDGYRFKDIHISDTPSLNIPNTSVPALIMALPESSIGLITRQELYTALARAEEKVILIGSRNTLDAARLNVDAKSRKPALRLVVN